MAPGLINCLVEIRLRRGGCKAKFGGAGAVGGAGGGLEAEAGAGVGC